MKRLQVLFALAYGHRGSDGRGGYVPGLSNEAMAQVIKNQDDRYDRVSVQQEIGTAMKDIGGEPDFEVLYGGREYLTTEQVIDAMLEDLRQESVDPKGCDIHVLCHPIHWSGCKWILQARGIKPRKAESIPFVCAGRVWRKIPYDPDSHQFQGRNAFNAWLYKFKAGAVKLLKGEISIFRASAQRGTTMPTIPTPTPTPVRRSILKTAIASLFIVAFVAVAAYAAVRAWGSQTDVVVGQLYNILIYPCEGAYDKGNGAMETERMYDVVFIGLNPRDMRRQLIHPSFVKQVDNVEPGQGGWVQIPVSYPEIEGIKYGTDGWRREFQYNGSLQPPSQTPQCRQ